MDRNSSSHNLTKTQLLAFFAMVVGMFMAILDIQIVASSLSVIGAGLSATVDELSWIQTSYLIAEVVVIPVSGYLSRALSTRIAFFVSAVGFTIMSALCACSWNISSMIIFRTFQGAFGGMLIPLTFTTSFLIFPSTMRGTVSMFIGLVVTVAPTLGPIIGGYITQVISWEFMFLINIIPGFFVCAISYLYIDYDKPNYSLFKNFDFLGVVYMVLALGCLEYVLEEGNKKDWLDSNIIILLSIVTISSFALFIHRSFTIENPIVNLRAFRNGNFRVGCIYSFILGVGLFGAVYLMPLFLYRVAGMNTLQIGLVMVINGIAQFFSAPIAGRLYDLGFNKRLMLLIGFVFFGLGCYTDSNLTQDSKFWEFFIPQILRGASLMFCFIPINDITLGTLPKDEVPNASSLYNLMRNIGGAVGLALINTNITRNAKIYYSYLSENITINSLSEMGNYPSFSMFGELGTKMMLVQSVEASSFIIAINNIFIYLSLLFAFCVLLIPFVQDVKNKA